MDNPVPPRHRSQRSCMVAMVLGTALSAFGPASTRAADATAEAIRGMGRYCTTCWRNARLPADAWGDCTQEVFSRLLERVPTERWGKVLQAEGEDRREFLRAIDAVKKRTQRARKGTGTVEAVADSHDRYSQNLREDREAVGRAAAELLSARQQRILQFSFEGWSVHDISSELSLPVERVSDEKYKAIRKLRAHLGNLEAGTPAASHLPA